MPKAMIYVRQPDVMISTTDEVHKLLFHTYETQFAAQYRFGGYYEDDIALASIDFGQRPGSNKIMVDAQRGDLVILQDFIHSFSGMKDMLSVIKMWTNINVSCHFNFMGLTVSAEEQGASEFMHELIEFDKVMSTWKMPKRPTHEQFRLVVRNMLKKGMTYTQLAKELTNRGFRNFKGQTWRRSAILMWCKRNLDVPKESAS